MFVCCTSIMKFWTGEKIHVIHSLGSWYIFNCSFINSWISELCKGSIRTSRKLATSTTYYRIQMILISFLWIILLQESKHFWNVWRKKEKEREATETKQMDGPMTMAMAATSRHTHKVSTFESPHPWALKANGAQDQSPHTSCVITSECRRKHATRQKLAKQRKGRAIPSHEHDAWAVKRLN